MGVAITTDTTDSVRTSFEMLKNLYEMPVQVVETVKVKLHYAYKVRNIGRVRPSLRFCVLC